MNPPLVSIIIPCHNSERWLAATLESALAQTWPNKEIILVDDGSTDGSLAVSRKFSARGVHVVDQANAGAAAARNHGLRLARGDYLQFLDADDLLAPDKIERQVRLLQAQGNDCLVSCAWGRFTTDPASSPLDDRTELWRNLSPADWLVLAAKHNTMMATATWLLPRALAEKAGLWDTSFRVNPLDDMDYFDRARGAAREVLFAPDTRTYYRSAMSGSLSQVRSEEAWRAIAATLHRSADLMLRLEDSPRTRHAAATLLQRFIYESYPALPDLTEAAAARVRQLGGTDLRPEFGPSRQRLADVIGWKLTKRLHTLLR